jgi:glycosyltransferase involved in cell wall biosynthesis
MSVSPTISVIIPVYNRQAFIGEAIQSVLDQTCSDYEIIVIDDGSTDETAGVVRRFDDRRIHYIYQDNQGVAAARNHGLRIAQGEYIAFLDSDDLFLPEKLETQLAYLRQNPNVGLVYTAYTALDVQNNHKTTHRADLRGDVYARLLRNCPIATPTVMIPRRVLEHAGTFDESLHLGEDVDLYIRIARHYEIGAINQPLTEVRLHSDNTLRDLETILNNMLYITRKNFPRTTPANVLFKQRVLADHYLNYGSMILTQQPDKVALVRGCLLRGFMRWPLHPKAYHLAGRLLFRMIFPAALQNRLRPLWRGRPTDRMENTP